MADANEWEDLRAYCRVCLEEPQSVHLLDMNKIYDQEANLSLYDCYELCTKQDLRQCNDNEPYTLCKRCGVELQWAYEFHKKVTKANQQLQELLFIHEREKLLFVATEEVVEQAQAYELIEETVEIVNEEISSEMKLNANALEGDTAISYTLMNPTTYVTGAFQYETESEDHVSQDTDPNSIRDDTDALYLFDSAEDVLPRQRHIGQYSCQTCQKVFRNYSRMMSHRLIHRSDRPQYKCNQCDRVYLTKQALKVHVAMKHELSGYTCTVCGKIYAIRKGLEIHMRYHTGDFPFACDQCERKFAQRSHLNIHKQVKHSSARFICEFDNCCKSFTSSNSLRNHECTHMEMPFECSYCQQGLSSRTKLRTHIRRKHDQELTLEQLESMRKFHIARSKLLLARIEEPGDNLNTH